MVEVELALTSLFRDGGDCRRCVSRLEDEITRLEGVQHADHAPGSGVVTVRFDAERLPEEHLRAEAARIGRELQERFHHQVLRLQGLDCADCAPTIERLLSRKEGMLEASVDFPGGTLQVEYDASRIRLEEIEREVERLGYGLEGGSREHHHTSVYVIPEMDCDEEIALIRKAVGALEGVEDLEFNLVSQRLTVTHRISEQAIERALQEVRMTPLREGQRREPGPARGPRRLRLLLTAGAGALIVAAVLLGLLGAPPWASTAAYLAAMGSGGWAVVRKAYFALRARSLDINVLMTLAVIGAAVIGEWLEGATVIFLFSVANLLESYSMERARRSIRNLMELSPPTARVRRAQGGDSEVVVPVEEVAVGETLLVRPGERIPLDGTVTVGASSVNQAPITGESLPVEKGPGDEVFGGTINGEGYLEARVTRRSKDTTLARIVHSVEEAQTRKAPSQSFVDRFARWYTPAVVAAAFLLAVLPPLAVGLLAAGGSGPGAVAESATVAQRWAPWLYRGLVLLVVACPCALVISTPVTIVSGLARAARDGVLVKGGVYLEALGTIRAYAFDKTGTLTSGRPEVVRVVALEERTEAEVLAIAASVESRSEHPLARAVEACARIRSIPYPHPAEFTALPGRGATALVNGLRYFVGNHRLFEERGWCSPALEELLESLEAEGSTVVIVGREGQPVGVLAVADRLRPEAAAAVRELHDLGIRRTVMLTGDNRTTARAVAAEAGLKEYRAELLPADKVAAVQELVREHGSAAMVGDGVNDAPALAVATVGVALGAAGSDAALETADVALMTDDLSRLALAVCLSRKVLRIVRQNIWFALALKAVFVALTPFGLTTLWMAVLADMGASLLVIGNGLRALRLRFPVAPAPLRESASRR
ncbi:MAG: heavy metal translocating P-type ATPase [Spirochaetales bacterium]|nr:heavy metal translocating P-type ATPase [Spirochaetales bacterium]